MHEKRFKELAAKLAAMTPADLKDEQTAAWLLSEFIDCAPPAVVADLFYTMAEAGAFPYPEAINPATGHPEFTADQIAEFFGISVLELETRYQYFNRRVGWESPERLN